MTCNFFFRDVLCRGLQGLLFALCMFMVLHEVLVVCRKMHFLQHSNSLDKIFHSLDTLECHELVEDKQGYRDTGDIGRRQTSFSQKALYVFDMKAVEGFVQACSMIAFMFLAESLPSFLNVVCD